MGKDKILHFVVCYSTVSIPSLLALKFFGPVWQTVGIIAGVLIAVIWSLLKEWNDDAWDWWDIAADTLGIIAGVMLT